MDSHVVRPEVIGLHAMLALVAVEYVNSVVFNNCQSVPMPNKTNIIH